MVSLRILTKSWQLMSSSCIFLFLEVVWQPLVPNVSLEGHTSPRFSLAHEPKSAEKVDLLKMFQLKGERQEIRSFTGLQHYRISAKVASCREAVGITCGEEDYSTF